MPYCTRSDVESLWNPAAVLAAADDDANGSLSADEVSHVSRAIDRAADELNAYLELRYDVNDLATNTWCRDANALLAAYFLSLRSGDAPTGLVAEVENLRSLLAAIRDGHAKAPAAAESFTSTAAVTNFTTRGGLPFRRSEE